MVAIRDAATSHTFSVFGEGFRLRKIMKPPARASRSPRLAEGAA
jgi:hypothetical protein